MESGILQLILIMTALLYRHAESLVPSIQALQLYNMVNGAEMNRILNQSPDQVGQNLYNSLYQDYIFNPDVNKLDITILMDSSQSLNFDNFYMGKQFVSEIISRMPANSFKMNGDGRDKVRVAMISFAVNLDLVREFNFNYSSYRELTRRAILGAAYQNGTYTHLTPALLWAKDQFLVYGRRDAHRLLLVATDGKASDDYANGDMLIPACQDLKTSGITVMVIPLGTHLNKPIIGALASDDNISHIFPVKNTRALERTLAKLTQLLPTS